MDWYKHMQESRDKFLKYVAALNHNGHYNYKLTYGILPNIHVLMLLFFVVTCVSQLIKFWYVKLFLCWFSMWSLYTDLKGKSCRKWRKHSGKYRLEPSKPPAKTKVCFPKWMSVLPKLLYRWMTEINQKQ